MGQMNSYRYIVATLGIYVYHFVTDVIDVRYVTKNRQSDLSIGEGIWWTTEFSSSFRLPYRQAINEDPDHQWESL